MIEPWGFPDGIFGVVARGAVKVFRDIDIKRYVTFDILTEGDWFLYSGTDSEGAQLYRYPDQISTLTTSCVLTMDRRRFMAVIGADPQFMECLFAETTHRLSGANERLIRFLSSSAEQKIAYLLLYLFEKTPRIPEHSGLIPFNLTKRDLASMSGHTLETVSRLMTDWEQEGIVRTGRGWVDILDREALRIKSAGTGF